MDLYKTYTTLQLFFKSKTERRYEKIEEIPTSNPAVQVSYSERSLQTMSKERSWLPILYMMEKEIAWMKERGEEHRYTGYLP